MRPQRPALRRRTRHAPVTDTSSLLFRMSARSDTRPATLRLPSSEQELKLSTCATVRRVSHWSDQHGRHFQHKHRAAQFVSRRRRNGPHAEVWRPGSSHSAVGDTRRLLRARRATVSRSALPEAESHFSCCSASKPARLVSWLPLRSRRTSAAQAPSSPICARGGLHTTVWAVEQRHGA